MAHSHVVALVKTSKAEKNHLHIENQDLIAPN